jgi:dolichol-phosphate mannosyltransferase
MKTSIIIPVYNEEKTVQEVIGKVRSLKIDKEIIVVDDGSSDNSYNLIKNLKGIKIFKHEKNKGKGAAVKTGIKNSTGDIIIIQDADLELNPEEIPKVIKNIADGKSEVVYGSRSLYQKKNNSERSLTFYLGGKTITSLTNLLYGLNLTDEPCGYKAFKSDVIKKIKINHNRFEWEPEITAKLAKNGTKIDEVPIRSSVRTIQEGKKLRRRDGLKAAWTLIKYRFVD